MKRIGYILFLIVATSLATSCDKIEADENGRYISYSGVSGKWSDGEPVTDHSQRVFLEKYTGCHCPNCPKADITINQELESFGDKLIAIAIHDSADRFSEPFSGFADFRTHTGYVWSSFFKIKEQGYPTAILNREMDGTGYVYFNPRNNVSDQIQAIIDKEAEVAVDVTSSTNAGNASITVSLEFLSNITYGTTLTLVVIENDLVSAQQNGSKVDSNYVHNHVLRHAITNPWGADIDANGSKGTCRTATFAFKDIKSEWNVGKCQVIAIVSKKDTREILNVAECAL